MFDSILIYSYAVAGIALHGVDNAVLDFLNDARMFLCS